MTKIFDIFHKGKQFYYAATGKEQLMSMHKEFLEKNNLINDNLWQEDIVELDDDRLVHINGQIHCAKFWADTYGCGLLYSDI